MGREEKHNEQKKVTIEHLKALKKLTPREIEVLEGVAEGHTSREIGEELYISYRTVQKHQENIRKKMSLFGYRRLFHWCEAHI